jgi:dihydroflavonol-4-reductase
MEDYPMNTAVVTGASGHLGANLVRLLVSKNWRITAMVHNDSRALENLEIARIKGDILDVESLKRTFQGNEVVFHLAARISVVKHDFREVEALNITGVINVVEACLAAGVSRLVHISSFHALRQEPLGEVLDESRPLFDAGRYPSYDYSKAEGEKIVNQAVKNGLDAIILSPTGMIGPYDYQPSHFGAALLLIAQGKFPALVDAGLNWVDVRDVAGGVLKACESARSGEKFILGGHWVSIKDIALRISEITHRSSPKVCLPLWAAAGIAPCVTAFDRLRKRRLLFTSVSVKELGSNKNISHAKANRELGYVPRPNAETVADTLEWFRSNGLLKRLRTLLFPFPEPWIVRDRDI